MFFKGTLGKYQALSFSLVDTFVAQHLLTKLVDFGMLEQGNV
jgi:hypothetical protein